LAVAPVIVAESLGSRFCAVLIAGFAGVTVRISLVERWNALAKVIYTHESTHVTIAHQDVADLNRQAQQLPTCDALFKFWDDPHVFDKLEADQAAFHARLRAHCEPAAGCIPAGWMGW